MNDTIQTVPAVNTPERTELERLWQHVEDFFDHLLHHSDKSKHEAIISMGQQTHHVVGTIAPEGSMTKLVNPEPEAPAPDSADEVGGEKTEENAVDSATENAPA